MVNKTHKYNAYSSVFLSSSIKFGQQIRRDCFIEAAKKVLFVVARALRERGGGGRPDH